NPGEFDNLLDDLNPESKVVIPCAYGVPLQRLTTTSSLKGSFPENSFEVLKLLENSVEVLKILENKLESMKILEYKLESLKLQENQPVDGLIHYGELDLPLPPPVIDNTRQPQMSDMSACLNDLSYIPLNNKQNKPAQGDIGKTSNDPTQAKRNKFEELYASANEELYPEFFQNVFPTGKGYKLPPSYYAIKKTFKMIRLGYESIHACVNDCFLFRGDANKDVHFCPVCNTSRWKDSNTPGKKVSKKVLLYFPIIPRLQRLYKSSHTAKEMTWHATKKCTEPGKMQHPVDGRAWKDFDTKYSDFTAEPRNVRLGLAADGFNPFGNLSQSYRMWPAKPGVETIDVATGLKFNIRAMVLWTINDSDDEDLTNLDIDDGVNMSADVARDHDNGGGDDRPPLYQVRAPESPIWVAGERAGCKPSRRPETSAPAKIYNGKKAALKERYWVPEEDGSYDLERIRRERSSHISEADWDEQLAFWNDPKILSWAV
nr:hypothetical protein [Tanacetum cinerariifolium]